MSYIGSFEHSVDGKGRVVVPSQFRDDFRDGGHLQMRRDHIALYDPAAWQAHMEKLRVLVASGELKRPQFNQLLALSADVSPDAQGRFGLPSQLRQMAEIGYRVQFVGADDYLAIYSIANQPVPEPEIFDQLMDVYDGLPL